MPLGAIIMRTASFKNLIWLHAGWMYFAYIMALVSMGLGIWMAVILQYFDQTHAIIGFVVIGSMLLQPVTGIVHHLRKKRTGRSNFATWAHVWWGRATIMLAIINGGLGLQLAAPYQPSTKTGEIVYGVVAGVMWLVWMGVILISFLKSRGVDDGETGDHIFTSDGEKQSEAQMSETGSYPTRNGSVAAGLPAVQPGSAL